METRPPVRTIPVWIRDAVEGDVPSDDDVPGPSAALIAQHNHSPSRTSRWASFAKANAYSRELPTAEIVSPEWLNEHWTDYSGSRGVRNGDEEMNEKSPLQRRRHVWHKRMRITLLRNPFIPLLFRLIVLAFSVFALALGGSIYHLTDVRRSESHAAGASFIRGASEEMAIVVDVIAIVYICYITYDEYHGKPLGLRSAGAKLRIVLLDLFFIVFESANLSIAFTSLHQVGEGCVDELVSGNAQSGYNGPICDRRKALSSVLLVALITWLLTFAVSITRLVERMVQK